MTDTVLTQATGDTVEPIEDDALDGATEASVRVIAAVAEATDTDPTTMEPLYEAIDPDALDRLVAAGVEGHVSFAFDDHDVTVHGDGTVLVDGTAQGGA